MAGLRRVLLWSLLGGIGAIAGALLLPGLAGFMDRPLLAAAIGLG
jgi:hypothetical protein